jgi:hypothetical protein
VWCKIFKGNIVNCYFLLTLVFIFPAALKAYDEEVLFENEEIAVYKWRLEPNESLGKHRDDNPQVVIATRGGTVVRVAEDGTTSEVILPTGKAVFQEKDTQLHDGINSSNDPIEAITIELKITK